MAGHASTAGPASKRPRQTTGPWRGSRPPSNPTPGPGRRRALSPGGQPAPQSRAGQATAPLPPATGASPWPTRTTSALRQGDRQHRPTKDHHPRRRPPQTKRREAQRRFFVPRTSSSRSSRPVRRDTKEGPRRRPRGQNKSTGTRGRVQQGSEHSSRPNGQDQPSKDGAGQRKEARRKVIRKQLHDRAGRTPRAVGRLGGPGTSLTNPIVGSKSQTTIPLPASDPAWAAGPRAPKVRSAITRFRSRPRPGRRPRPLRKATTAAHVLPEPAARRFPAQPAAKTTARKATGPFSRPPGATVEAGRRTGPARSVHEPRGVTSRRGTTTVKVKGHLKTEKRLARCAPGSRTTDRGPEFEAGP